MDAAQDSDDGVEGARSEEYFSIKNNCRTPYCTKLVNEWTPYPSDLVKSLAYVSIAREFFDPVVDPDLIDYISGGQSEVKFMDSPDSPLA